MEHGSSGMPPLFYPGVRNVISERQQASISSKLGLTKAWTREWQKLPETWRLMYDPSIDVNGFHLFVHLIFPVDVQNIPLAIVLYVKV